MTWLWDCILASLVQPFICTSCANERRVRRGSPSFARCCVEGLCEGRVQAAIPPVAALIRCVHIRPRLHHPRRPHHALCCCGKVGVAAHCNRGLRVGTGNAEGRLRLCAHIHRRVHIRGEGRFVRLPAQALACCLHPSQSLKPKTGSSSLQGLPKACCPRPTCPTSSPKHGPHSHRWQTPAWGPRSPLSI